jgi:hypothetical protein
MSPAQREPRPLGAQSGPPCLGRQGKGWHRRRVRVARLSVGKAL